MTKRQFNHQFDPDRKLEPYMPKGKSMTVPDQALTVRQLLERQQAGFKFDGAIKAGEYFEDREVPHFTDRTEYDAWKEEQEQLLKQTKKAHEKVQKNRRDLEKKQKEEMEKPKPAEKTAEQTAEQTEK